MKIINFKLLILVIILFISCKNKYTKEIDKSCTDCTEVDIEKFDIILVTNKEGKSNVFSKNNMKFLLSEWYEAKYDKGIFFDDITFNVQGQKVMCSEDDFKNLSDEFIKNKSSFTCSYCKRTITGKPSKHLDVLGESEDFCSENCFTSAGYSYGESSVKSNESSELTCVHGKKWVDCCRYKLTRP
jgi:hypothetical protein